MIGVVDGDLRRTYVEMGRFAWSSDVDPPYNCSPRGLRREREDLGGELKASSVGETFPEEPEEEDEETLPRRLVGMVGE